MKSISFIAVSVIAAGLTACSGPEFADPDAIEGGATVPISVPSTEDPTAEADRVELNGEITISVDRLVSEAEACLLMMEVENGTSEDVSAGLFSFNVTGNGETSGANMFPQTAQPGSEAMAQIVLQGADCENALLIEGGQIACRIAESGESCTEVVTLEDGAVAFDDTAQ